MKYRFPVFLLALAFLSLTPIRQLHAVSAQGTAGSALKVSAVETFLADMAQNVAGSRVKVVTLLPIGADPHSFDPAPADVAKAADCNVLIVNGAGRPRADLYRHDEVQRHDDCQRPQVEIRRSRKWRGASTFSSRFCTVCHHHTGYQGQEWSKSFTRVASPCGGDGSVSARPPVSADS